MQGEEGNWQLGLTSPTGEFQTVARFAARKDAEQAFTETEKILAYGKNRWLGYVTKFLGAMGFLFVLLVLGFGVVLGINALHILPKSQAYTSTTGANATQRAKPSDIKTGVPLPADEYLTPP